MTQDSSEPDDIGPREAEIYREMLAVLRVGLYVLAALGGAGLGAEHFGLI